MQISNLTGAGSSLATVVNDVRSVKLSRLAQDPEGTAFGRILTADGVEKAKAVTFQSSI